MRIQESSYVWNRKFAIIYGKNGKCGNNSFQNIVLTYYLFIFKFKIKDLIYVQQQHDSSECFNRIENTSIQVSRSSIETDFFTVT